MLLNCGAGEDSWVHQTVKRSNQWILKEFSPEYSLKGLMLKLKLQYLGHLMWIADSLDKTLMLGQVEGRRRRRQHRITWLKVIADSMDMKWNKSCAVVLALCDPMDHTVHGILLTRTLESVAISIPRGSSQPRDWTQVYYISAWFLTSWATREAPMDISLSKLREILKDRETCCAAVHGATKSWTWLNSWTTIKKTPNSPSIPSLSPP